MKFYFYLNVIKINFNTKFIITIYLIMLLSIDAVKTNKFIKKSIIGIENKKIVEMPSEKDDKTTIYSESLNGKDTENNNNNNLSIKSSDMPSELENKKITANRGSNLSSVSIVNGEPVLKVKTGKVFGNRVENEENSGNKDDVIDTKDEIKKS